MRHFIKHLSLFDKIFFLLFVSLAILSGITGDWRGVVYTSIFALFILLLAGKDMTVDHLRKLIDLQFKLLDDFSNAVGGRKIVKTETTEFVLEKSPKKAEGKKPNEKQRNEDTPNARRSRSGSSKKPAGSPKTANRKGTGTASVPNRKPKATKTNRKA